MRVLLLLLAAAVGSVAAWDNGAARTPTRGWQNWNGFSNDFNASLTLEVAHFLKDSGLLAAGFEYLTLGGMGYAEHGDPQIVPGFPNIPKQNITRNATGHLQVDAARFPGPGSSAGCLAGGAELAECLLANNYSSPEACGCVNGNEGMRNLTDYLRSLGFKFGIYTAAGINACDGAHGTSEGYEQQDADLFVNDWKAEYLMVDSCGAPAMPPPHGPPPGFPGGQGRWELTRWHNMLAAKQQSGAQPILLHDCHIGCGSNFAGPTLAVKPCDAADPHQQWAFDISGNHSALVDQARGLCAGCGGGPMSGCGGSARNSGNASGVGLGMQACLLGSIDMGKAGQPNPHMSALGTGDQLFNISANGTLRNRGGAGSPGACLGVAGGGGGQVVQGFGAYEFCDQGWTAKPRGPERNDAHATYTDGHAVPRGHATADALQYPVVQLELKASPGHCLSSAGEQLEPDADPWCKENNNMWRSNTDVLQCWPRTMVEVESVATQSTISEPGAWSFPDCLELGVPGYGSYTWNEAQAVLSLFAVTSSPLMLGNDARPGRMQQRLVDLLTNPDLLAVNSYYSQKERNAGGRIWSGPVGKELWAKPLAGGSTAVVLLNRAGLASGNALGVRNPYFAPYAGCFDLHGRADAILAPCDDNATASHGAQSIALNLSAIPRSWLGLAEEPNVDSALESTLSCEVFDILATAKAGASLGPQKDSAWAPVVPPHGVRFVRVSNCTESRSRRLKTDDQTATVASAPRNPDRIKGEYMWCECGTGSRSVTVWPTGQRNLSVAVRAAAPLPNFIDFGRTVQRVSWLCDGMKAPKELYFSGAVKSKWWWTASLPIPLAGGLPTHPVGCSQDRDTGRLHLAAWQDLPADGDSVSSVVFATGEGPPSVPKPYACIKIPVLLYTAKRTLLAIAEARLVSCSDGAQTDLIVKRSTDNGRSWSHAAILRSSPGDTIGNAAPVQLRTVQQPHLDRIIVPHTRNNSDVWVTESDDDGMTFSKARLLPNVSRDGWNWVGTGPPGSIEVTGGEHAGRLVVPCYHSEDRANNNIAHGHVMLSDDQGATFRLGFVQPAADDKHWNECQVAQLSDGHLLVNARSLANPLEHQQRIQAISTDGGETFGPTRYIPELPQPINGCEGSMVVAAEHNNNSSSSSTKQLLLLSGPDSKLLRTGMVIWWSADGGESWRKALDVDPGTSGYSSLQFMPAAETGTEAVGLLYEQSDGVEVVMTPDRFIFRRFSLPVLDAGRNEGRNS